MSVNYGFIKFVNDLFRCNSVHAYEDAITYQFEGGFIQLLEQENLCQTFPKKFFSLSNDRHKCWKAKKIYFFFISTVFLIWFVTHFEIFCVFECMFIRWLEKRPLVIDFACYNIAAVDNMIGYLLLFALQPRQIH